MNERIWLVRFLDRYYSADFSNAFNSIFLILAFILAAKRQTKVNYLPSAKISTRLNRFSKLAIIRTMTDSRFDLILTGNIAPGVSREAAINKLAALFKRPAEQVDKLLNGKPSRIRKDLNQAELQRYQQAFNNIGVITKVMAATPTPVQTAESKILPSSNLSLCPNGTPVLTADEREHPPLSAPDTDHLSIADIGQTLAESDSIPPVPAPDTTHLSLTAAGTNLLPPAAPQVFTAPQNSHLSLCCVGTPLLDEKPKATYRTPNTEHLKLL